ncbi:CHASE3 domain-containing protein [Novosphingobium bradum]|uniref:histidine kinase n=1 Tax=Novosphingobium bradum TaxID=1737444 RepID=A0ABV7IPN5_9SPHN
MDGIDQVAPGRHRGPRLPTLLLLGFVAAALIGAVALMWQTVAAERSQRAQAARTNAVLVAVRDIMRTATNGETGQRGYLITLDRRYLGPYVAARARYRPELQRLRALIGTDLSPRQRELLDQIETLDEARFAELSETVALIAGGDLLEARRRVLTDEGQDVMERLRRAVGELEELEFASLRHSSQRAEAAEARLVPLLVGLLAMILLVLGLGLTQVIRAADAEARAQGAAELGRARDRADLLAHELNHRVKNLFAVVLAIVKMSARDAPEARPVITRITERIHALLTAHEVTQGTSAHRSANLVDLVETALRPYRSDENRAIIDGPRVDLPETAVVPLGLMLHELTTNAVKYGAWSRPDGTLVVRWERVDGRLRLDWVEQCPPPEGPSPDGPSPAEPGHRGFGAALIDGSARQLGGTIERRFTPGGIAVRIDLPLAE